jgi:neutral trehalase
MLEDVSNFGFVPNGGRIYYLDRSQPPLLTLIVAEYLTVVGTTLHTVSALQSVADKSSNGSCT